MSDKQTKAKSTTPKRKYNYTTKPGRPTKYRKQYGQMFIDASKSGSTIEEFASSIGVHQDSLKEWAKVHPEFSAAYKVARQESLVYMQKIGKAAMFGKIQNFNPTLYMFWMKCVHGWKDAVLFDDLQVDLNFVE